MKRFLMPQNAPIRRVLLGCLAVIVLGTSACAGQSVTPIDIHDPVISVESRRFVADAQDAVSIARSGFDYADQELRAARQQRARLMAGDAALEDLRQANGRVAEQLLVVDRSSRAWWKSYRGLLSQNKHPNMFFTNF